MVGTRFWAWTESYNIICSDYEKGSWSWSCFPMQNWYFVSQLIWSVGFLLHACLANIFLCCWSVYSFYVHDQFNTNKTTKTPLLQDLYVSINFPDILDPRRFKLVHQTSFGKRHIKYWSDHPLLRWPASFLRQFHNSVSRVDYLTLRHGFIAVYLKFRSATLSSIILSRLA